VPVTPPPVWGASLRLGISDGLGGAAAFRADVPIDIRYQYLAGGVSTGHGWQTWNADGRFAARYIAESRQSSILPVLTYYMLLQSGPGAGTDEQRRVLGNLADPNIMAAYFDDLEALLQQAGEDGLPVLVHIEPDAWGFIQLAERQLRGARVPVAVRATGRSELAAFSDDPAGLAQAIVAMRDRLAPAVLLGYHLSVWGTGTDLLRNKPRDGQVQELADASSAFYRSLGASFDVLLSEFNDRDAAFKEHIYNDRGSSWWQEADHHRFASYLALVSQAASRPLVLWQIPVGNTRMRAMDNTWGHFQDNLVEALLDDPSETTLRLYTDAGVIGLLFGPGADGATCYCDSVKDGVTNPQPVNGNTAESISVDDDGGYFRSVAATFLARRRS
jgi:hypothetical protein